VATTNHHLSFQFTVNLLYRCSHEPTVGHLDAVDPKVDICVEVANYAEICNIHRAAVGIGFKSPY